MAAPRLSADICLIRRRVRHTAAAKAIAPRDTTRIANCTYNVYSPPQGCMEVSRLEVGAHGVRPKDENGAAGAH